MKKTTLVSIACLLASSTAYAQVSIFSDEVVVTAARIPQSRESVLADVTVIDQAEIESSGQSSLIELLQKQPGVEITSNGGMGTTTSVFLRGTNSGHALVLIDGVRMGSVTLGSAAFEQIPLDQIDHIEILRGPGSALYGSDAIGGVIQIFTKAGQGAPHLHASIGYGTYHTTKAETGISGAVNDTKFNLQAGYVDSDAFSALKNQKGLNADKDGYRNTNLSASISHAITPDHEIGASFLRSEGHDHFDGWSNFNYRDTHTLQSWSIFAKDSFLPSWQSELRIGRSTDGLVSFSSDTPDKYRTVQTQANWQNNIAAGPGTLLLGAEWLNQEVNSSTVFAVTERDTRSLLAGYLVSLQNHSIQANVRNDDNSQFGNHTTGSLAYGYRFTPEWRAMASAGTAFKAPTFNDLYWPDDGCGDKGNNTLQAEKGRNLEAALHFEHGPHHASATLFDNRIQNLIEWTPIGPSVCGFPAWMPSNLAQAHIQGLTLAYQGQLADFLVKSSIDLQSPEDNLTGNTLVRRARAHGNVWLGRTFGKLEMGTELAATGQRYGDSANTQKLGGYALLNLTAKYALNQDWSVTARANNVFDRTYELAQGYNTPGANLFVGLRWQPK